MFFSAKSKGFFVEQSEHTTLLARTSAPVAPFTIEEVRECPAGDTAALAEAVKALQPKKTPSGYLNACCGIYPASRFVRRASLELKRVKEPGYLAEVLSQQFRIEAEKHTVHVLNATDGTDFDVNRAVQKETLFCGLPADDVTAIQDRLLENTIYPERLELGSVAMLGALSDYLKFTKSKSPTLVLEIGADVTHSFIVSSGGVEASRPIAHGLESMIPVVQKELGLKDEESAKKLFLSNTFDFTGMGPLLIKKLLKELQSSIGFYEVQTGMSVGQIVCTQLPAKLTWLENAIANALGISRLELALVPWLQSRQITVSDAVISSGFDPRWIGLLGLMIQHNLSDAVAAETKD